MPMTAHPAAFTPAFPVLVADIGGTNARFALVNSATSPSLIFPIIATARFADPIDAIESLAAEASWVAPRSAILAIAGPVTGDEVPLTNCPWTVAPKRMIAQLGLEDVVLVNDFEAQALALPSLGAEDVLKIGGGESLHNAPMAVLGPGTGLGVASMIQAGGVWFPVPGEGGHVSLGPETARDFEIWPHIEPLDGRVTAEHILSGSGILRLARAIAAADRVACPYASPEAVTEGAEGGEPLAVETLETFARLLGRLAGDMALVALARGGVFIAGGVSLKIQRFLTDGAFRRAFEDKAPHRGLVAGIPTYLVTHPRPALVGLAGYASAPQLFALELDGRRWRR